MHRWAYDFSVPGAKYDFIPQNMAEEDVEKASDENTSSAGTEASDGENS